MSDMTMGYIAHAHYGFARVPCRDVDGMAIFDDDIRLMPVEHHNLVEGMALARGVTDLMPRPLDQLDSELRDALVTSHGWPGRKVSYQLPRTPFGSVALTDKQHAAIQAGIDRWRATGIFQFEEGTPTSGFLDFNVGAETNNSAIGRRPDHPDRNDGRQALNLTSDADADTVAHEIGHALGLPHEHKRRDAQSYVDIHWGNIIASVEPDEVEAKLAQFTSDAESLKVGYYDFGSIMHYSRDGSSTTTQSGTVQLEPLDANARLRQRLGLAISDLNAATAVHVEGISTITVELGTAPPDGALYLGLGGRELRVQHANGQSTVQGDLSNPPLSTRHVLGLPMYLRLAGATGTWNLTSAEVTLAVRELHDPAAFEPLPEIIYKMSHRTELGPGKGWRVHLERQSSDLREGLPESFAMTLPDLELQPLSARKIRTIDCRLQVDNIRGSGSVFLGLAGREFPVNPGQSSFAFGENEAPTEGDLQQFPTYLYVDHEVDWCLVGGSVTVTLTPEPGDSAVQPIELVPALGRLRLNGSCGEACQLRYKNAPRHHSDPPVASPGSTRPPTVRQIRVVITPAAGARPGSDAPLFLGLGGRELRLALEAGNPAPGPVTFKLGRGSNVRDPSDNDPSLDQPAGSLTLLDVDTHPCYLRQEGSATWTLTSVKVTVTFEGPCRDPFYWMTKEGGMVTSYRTFSSTTDGRTNPPMAVHLKSVYENLPLGGSAGRQCALVRTLPS